MDKQSGRCDECRAEVVVPGDYAHGDKVRCDSCGAQLRVLRGTPDGSGPVRLVMADSGPLRIALEQNRQLQARLQADLQTARASLGIGVNGLGVGVLYVVARMGLEQQPLTTALLVTAGVIAVAVGLGLEAANFFFLAKRSAMDRLSTELAEARSTARQLQGRIREADRPHGRR